MVRPQRATAFTAPAYPPTPHAIGALSRARPVNLATALRQHARDPIRPLATLRIDVRMKRTLRDNAGALHFGDARRRS
jgi:hypothetical protein